MEKTLQQLWNNFKAQPEIWFFYGFLLTSMLLVRKVLAEYPLAGAFNEYTGIYLYLSDIFLLLGLLSWGISILKNKNDDLSRYRLSWNALKPLFYALAVFLGWALVSVAWAERPEIGYFKFLKLFEMVLLGLFLGFHPSQNVPRGTSDGASAKHGNNFRWNILRIIIFLGVLNSLIGIGQFLLQHSVGLFWLRESLIGPDIPGVAKIIIGGQKYIRIYGLFPHPNILAGFLLLSILATLVYRKMFYLTPTFSLARRGRLGEVGICSMWNIS